MSSIVVYCKNESRSFPYVIFTLFIIRFVFLIRLPWPGTSLNICFAIETESPSFRRTPGLDLSRSADQITQMPKDLIVYVFAPLGLNAPDLSEAFTGFY